MDHDATPTAAYVIAQTGPGSAFSAGSPTSDPSLTRAPSAKEPPNGPKPKTTGPPPDTAVDVPTPVPPPNAAPPSAAPIVAFEHPTYAAADYRPRGIVEKDFCQRASSPDYVYLASTFALAGAAVAFDTVVGKHWQSPGARVTSSGFVGLTWGGFLGGGYLSLPKCSPDFVPPVSPEGAVTTRWPLALAVSLISGITAPFLVYIETGYVPVEWKQSERGARIYVPGLAGIAGALLPWIPAIAPKTYRNALKLERLRIEGSPVPPGAARAPAGAMLGYSFGF